MPEEAACEQMTLKQVITLSVSIVGAMGVIATIHGTTVVPAIVKDATDQARKDTMEAIRRHEDLPRHTGTVSRDELQWMRDAFASMERRLERIEVQVSPRD